MGLAGQVEPSRGNPRDAAEAWSKLALPKQISFCLLRVSDVCVGGTQRVEHHSPVFYRPGAHQS